MQSLQWGHPAPLREPALSTLLEKLRCGWQIVEKHYLEKEYRFRDFRQAWGFTNRIGRLAESVGHPPDLHLVEGNGMLEVWTHKLGGLSEADFIFAAKVDALGGLCLRHPPDGRAPP